jgi:hypothetical protein
MQTGYAPLSFPDLATRRGAPGLMRDPVDPEPVRGGR